jgi:hypothetical protein
MAVLSLPPSLFSSAQLTSPGRISADLLKSLCDKCEFAFIVLLVVGALLSLTLLFIGARASAVRRPS